jgi:hypothetical protein
VVAVAASAVLLLAVPYLTPFLSLQRVVPLLSTLRFPRFYVIAPLGLALGAAYPVTLIHRWVPAGDRQTATLLSAALCLALAGAFLVDIRPYRSFYRVREPHSSAAYRQAAESLAAAGDTSRVAIDRLDPRSAAALLDSGHELSVGWPHPVASGQLWRLTIEPYLSPPDYRDAALGLSATGYLAVEQTVATGTAFESVRDVRLLRNPKVLPLVRAYPQALVVRDRSIAPELATSLAYRNVAVVTGDRRATRSLGGVPGVTVESGRPCSDASTAGLGPGLAGDVATACAMHSWLGVVFAGIDVFPSEGGPGAVFTALADGLRGVSVWLDRPPGRTQVTVHELEADGRTPGREVARALSSGTDANGLTTFAFDPVAGSAGHRYVFRVSCAECALMSTPGLITGPALRGPGDLVVGQQLRTDRVAAFTPVYDRLPSSPSATTELRATRPGPGRWVVEASGSEPALVVVAEARFPGWRARVDGRAVPVLEADGAFLGVPVPAGRHRVTLEYRRPAAAVAGRLVTVVTLVALAVVAVRRRGWVVPPPGAGRPPPSGGG